ncbi:CHAT domain-containing protein [Amycolatopsis sp. MEPSY49]|uniref:CHAT domain-containing protein n=1 Tax=Amycolatopsis sp. MEPSY49 TaxID=3151600 RepID=UPI003EF6737C
MTPTNWVWTLPLVLVAIACAILQLPLRAAQTRRNPVALMIVGLVLWTLIGWVTHRPLAWVAGTGWGGVLALVVVGVLLGGVGLAQAGAGAALVYTFLQPDEMLLLGWVAPIVVGSAAQSLVVTLRRRSAPVDVRRVIRDTLRYGDVIQPPVVVDRVLRVLLLAIGAVPVLLAAVLPFPGATTVGWWTRVGVAVLIAVQVWWFDSKLRGITRYLRRAARSGLVWVVVALGLAATPFGTLVVDLLRLLPGPDGVVSGLVLVGLDVLVGLSASLVNRTQHIGSIHARRARLLLVMFVREIALRRGVLVFAAVGLFHPADDLLVAAAMLVVFELVTSLTGFLNNQLTVMSISEAEQIIHYQPGWRRHVFGCWLYDSFLARPHRPDYGFVVRLSWSAMQSSHRPPAAGGTAALQWLEIAEEAIDLVDAEVVPRFPDRHVENLRREQHRARWMCHFARARVHQSLNWRDDAVASWRAAADHARSAHAPITAALAQASAAAVLTDRLARPRDALRELEELLQDNNLAAPAKHFALLMATSAHLALDELETARGLLEHARATTPDRRGWRAADAEEAGSAVRSFGRSGRKGHIQEFRWVLSILAWRLEGGELTEAPKALSIPAMSLALQALAADHRGDLELERRLLLEAVEVGTRDGHLTWVHNAHLRLAWMTEDVLESYGYACAAMDVLEEMRGRVLDADLRIGAGAVFPGNAYEIGAELLVTQGELDAPGWPRDPYGKAFELVESARSRVFLEQLGESTASADLSEDEKAAVEELQRAIREQAEASDAGRPALLHRVRTAQTRLDQVWNEIAESGVDGEEHVRSRRGEPMSIGEVRGYLADGTVLAEYFVTDDRTTLFLVRAEQAEPEVVVIELSRDDLRAAVAESRADPVHVVTQAFRSLVEPLLERCAEGERLCLVPHDALHLVPLHAVEVAGTSLAERHAVSYLPAAGLLRYTNTGAARTTGATIMADSRADRPLAHARVQAAEVAQLLAAPVELLIGAEVTTDAVRSVTGRVWHVACHGEFDEGDPQRSGILLADGRCTVADLMSLRLNCDLVTFSACETGLAEQAPGDELLGLTRSLIYAGALAVLVSLWQVDEISTSILMRAFYEALATGAAKPVALSEAQRRLRSMTVADAIAYCQNVARHLDTPLVIERDIADLRFRARDFTAAAEAYADLADQAPADSPLRRELLSAAARSRRAGRTAATPNYELRPYEEPYHWASFVLVGDWR